MAKTKRLTAKARFDIRQALAREIRVFVWLLILPVPLLVNGCAVAERRASAPVPIVAAEGYLKESRRKNLSTEA